MVLCSCRKILWELCLRNDAITYKYQLVDFCHDVASPERCYIALLYCFILRTLDFMISNVDVDEKRDKVS